VLNAVPEDGETAKSDIEEPNEKAEAADVREKFPIPELVFKSIPPFETEASKA